MFQDTTDKPKPIEKPNYDSQVVKFVDLYRKFLAGIRWNNEQLDKGVDISHMMPKFQALEKKIDSLWNLFSDEERRQVTEKLCADGDLDEQTEYVLKLYSGQITDMTTERIDESCMTK